jgi:hypothetical protein
VLQPGKPKAAEEIKPEKKGKTVEQGGPAQGKPKQGKKTAKEGKSEQPSDKGPPL